jgi:hypothetical protein
MIDNAKTITHESEDDDSDLDSEAEGESANERNVMDAIAADLRFYNHRLMDLMPSIERTAVQPAQLQGPNDHSALSPFQMSEPAHAYVIKVADKFPDAESKLVERLGEANWQRHVRIRQSSGGTAEIVPAEVPKSVFVPVSMFHDSGLGSSMPAQSAYAATAASHSSFKTTMTESQSGSYRVPPTPKEVYAGESFTCEICGHFLSKIRNRIDWKYGDVSVSENATGLILVGDMYLQISSHISALSRRVRMSFARFLHASFGGITSFADIASKRAGSASNARCNFRRLFCGKCMSKRNTEQISAKSSVRRLLL